MIEGRVRRESSSCANIQNGRGVEGKKKGGECVKAAKKKRVRVQTTTAATTTPRPPNTLHPPEVTASDVGQCFMHIT